MKTLTLQDKAAMAVTYFDALASDLTTEQYAVKLLGYQVEESEQVVKLWSDCFKEMNEIYPWDQVIVLSQETIKDVKVQGKKRSKVKGMTAQFQSDRNGCSYVAIDLKDGSADNTEIMRKIVELMESWDYGCVEFLEGESAVLFGDDEFTLKKMKDDYAFALKTVLN